MERTNKELIAVVGATGQQGGGVVRALQARGQFRVRALTRNPYKHPELADEVAKADLNLPETLKAAFERARGVFLVTNFWEQGTDELKEATAAVRAAKDAGVKHFVWSTLPDVEAISGGKFDVPHFTGKAKIDRIVREAGFVNHTFVIAPSGGGHMRFVSNYDILRRETFRLKPRWTSVRIGCLGGRRTFGHGGRAGSSEFAEELPKYWHGGFQ